MNRYDWLVLRGEAPERDLEPLTWRDTPVVFLSGFAVVAIFGVFAVVVMRDKILRRLSRK